MSNTPPFPKDMPHIGLIPGEIDTDLSSSQQSFVGGPRSGNRFAGSASPPVGSPWDLMDHAIRNRPTTAVLIAFGAGILFGLTTRR